MPEVNGSAGPWWVKLVAQLGAFGLLVLVLAWIARYIDRYSDRILTQQEAVQFEMLALQKDLVEAQRLSANVERDETEAVQRVARDVGRYVDFTVGSGK